MGYIQYGRHSLRQILRFRSASNAVRNSARSPLGCVGTGYSPFRGKCLYSDGAAPEDARLVMDLLAQVERDRLRKKNERIRAGLDTADIDAECDEDYMV